MVGRGGASTERPCARAACGASFTSRRDTPLYRLKTASARVAEVLRALSEGLDVAAAVLLFGQRHATITTWLRRAGMHSATLHDRSFQGLHLPHVQRDELRTRLRRRAHTLWLWVAVEPISKLIPGLHHAEGTGLTDPGRRACPDPRPAPETAPRVHRGLQQRWGESVLLCADRPFWAVGGRYGAARAAVAGRHKPDLRAGQEALAAPAAGGRDVGAALGDAHGVASRPCRGWA